MDLDDLMEDRAPGTKRRRSPRIVEEDEKGAVYKLLRKWPY
jgi:hypothetical protein